MLEVQTTLEQKRQEFRVKLDRMKAEENRLSSKRDELQDSLSKFNKFIQENEVKRSRADKKAIEEAKSKEDKEVEKQRLGKDVETMEKEKWKMWDQLQKSMFSPSLLFVPPSVVLISPSCSNSTQCNGIKSSWRMWSV